MTFLAVAATSLFVVCLALLIIVIALLDEESLEHRRTKAACARRLIELEQEKRLLILAGDINPHDRPAALRALHSAIERKPR
jgi:hypothetical protein